MPFTLSRPAPQPAGRPEFVLDDEVGVQAFADVARGDRQLRLSGAAEARTAASHDRLRRLVDEQRVVYGITTGFGPLANRRVDSDVIAELQRNLAYHLASGVGAPLSWLEARAMLLARLVSITRGYSGASAELIDLVIAVLNSNYAPKVPEKGTVGASGDLTPLAHVALALLGEGMFITQDGVSHAAGAVLKELGCAPCRFENRDGLALVNGTSCMTGLAALSAGEAETALEWAVILSVVHAEIYGARLEAWRPEFAAIRPHHGQIEITARLGVRVRTGSRFKRTPIAEGRSGPASEAPVPARAIQDPYTVRCVPQVLGAVADVLSWHEKIVLTELNAVTDNPILVPEEPFALHGGNFFGQHVAFASDALANALIGIGVLAERQLAWLVDERQNGGLLPPFLQPRTPGLHSGFMGAQVTASALLAELRTLAIPASIQSIPTNGNNQDVVSMGTIGARKVRRILDDLMRILAIEALALTQALDLLEEETESYSETARSLRQAVRRVAPHLDGDRPLSGEIERLAEKMKSGAPGSQWE